MDPNQPLEELRRLVKRTFDPDDLHTLSTDLHLDHNDFKREDHGVTVRNIIEYFIRDGRIAFFIKECVERFPNANFKRLQDIAERTPQAFELTSVEHGKTEPATESKLLEIAMELLKAQSSNINAAESPRHEGASKKPHPPTFQPQFNEGHRDAELWYKPTGMTPTKNRPQIEVEGKLDKDNNNSPIIDRLQNDITRLEANLETMEKMEGLLEEVREKIGYLLEGLREEKFEIKSKVKVQHEIMKEELMKAAGEPIEFQEDHKSSFMTPKPGKESQSGNYMPNLGGRGKSPSYKLGY